MSFGLTLGSFGFAMLWAFASCVGPMVRPSQRLFVSNLEPGTREDWVRKLLGILAEFALEPLHSTKSFMPYNCYEHQLCTDKCLSDASGFSITFKVSLVT